MMFQYFTANGVGAILLVLVGVKVNTIKGGQNRTSFGQSERGMFIFGFLNECVLNFDKSNVYFDLIATTFVCRCNVLLPGK